MCCFVRNRWDLLSSAYHSYDFDPDRGIGSKGYEELDDLECDAFEFGGDIGKQETGILDLYMLAFKLAKKQLDKQ